MQVIAAEDRSRTNFSKLNGCEVLTVASSVEAELN